MSDDENNKKNNESGWEEAGWFALKTAAMAGGVIGGSALALSLAGFNPGGVSPGSLAALYQSKFLGGFIKSGSAFSIGQRVGERGMAVGTKVVVVAVSATLAGVSSLWNKLTNNEGGCDNNSEEPSESDKDENVGDGDEAMEKNDDWEEPGKTIKSKDFLVPDTSSRGKDPTIPVKVVKKYRNNDANNSLKFNYGRPKYEDEMDSLRKEFGDVELSNHITITQNLIKK